MNYNNHGFSPEECDWDEPEVMMAEYNNRPHGNFRNDRYSKAYGDYRGGYGPGGGFGPPPHFGGGVSGPMGRYGPPVMGQGFGPNGPPMTRRFEDRAMRYLMPRMHYSSKNHLKNQKKYMMKHSEGFGMNSREIPMKARDLFCELCDVHITSKVHAESHYSGKQHRATVEGRKNPKNPILLQHGMEHRLEQLIRREKKHLKPIEESAVVVAEAAKKEEKPISPELYCDICKTSVTCTDQMTMHLNGKKHLSKEKQHILLMMNLKKAKQAKKAKQVKAEDKEETQGDVVVEDNSEEKVANDDQEEPSLNKNGEDEQIDDEQEGDKLEGSEVAADAWANGSGGDWEETA